MTEKIPRPLIAITMGDPAGIGPEIILKALAAGSLPKNRYVVIGDRGMLEKTGRRLGKAIGLTATSDRSSRCPKGKRGIFAF